VQSQLKVTIYTVRNNVCLLGYTDFVEDSISKISDLTFPIYITTFIFKILVILKKPKERNPKFVNKIENIFI